MVLRIAETEDCIVSILEGLSDLDTYTIRNYPGTAEQQGKVHMCEGILVQFVKVEYPKPTNLYAQCAQILPTATFNIQIRYWDLQCHQDAYEAAEAIIENIRGKQILKFDTSAPTRCSGAYITGFTFKEVEEEEIFLFDISISSQYPITYPIEACKP